MLIKNKKGFVLFNLLVVMIFGAIYFVNNDTNIHINSNKKELKVAYTDCGPIHINNNWSDAKIAGICTGNGIWGAPYVIEGYRIVGNASTEYGILIENSYDIFEIRDCLITNCSGGGGGGDSYGAIKLSSTDNGRIENNTIYDNYNINGILLDKSKNNTIIKNNITQSGSNGISLSQNSDNNTLSLNFITLSTYDGLMMDNVDDINVNNNTIIANQWSGIFAIESRYNNFYYNNITNNGRYGVNIDVISTQQQYNDFYRNLVYNNSWSGICVNWSDYNKFIHNDIIDNKKFGVILDKGAEHNDFNENLIIYNDMSGVYSENSDYNNFSGNKILNNDGYGLEMHDVCDYNEFWWNNISDNTEGGILLNDSWYAIIRNNFIRTNPTHAIHVFNSEGETIEDNSFIGGGIFLEGSRDQSISHTINNNMINGKPLYYLKEQYGGSVPYDAGAVIIANCSWIWAENLDLSFTTIGIQLLFCMDNCRVQNNLIINNSVAGIYMMNSINTNIWRNNISNNEFGIILADNSDSNWIEENIFKNNTVDAICLKNSYNNKIKFNRFWGNGRFGVNINNLGGTNNRIYINDFEYNNPGDSDQVNETNYNIWDYAMMGNYWTDYISKGGSDSDKDGFGDVPFLIGGDLFDYDYRPLIYPIEYYDREKIFVDDDFDSSTLGWNITRFDNIQEGINAADNMMGMASVFVYNGTYNENVLVNKSDLDLIGESRDGTIIDGGFNDHTVEINAYNCEIRNFTIRNSMNAVGYAGVFINPSCTYNLIENCNITNNYDGVRIQSASDNDIKNCSISFNSIGVDLGTADYTEIAGCKIYNNSGSDGIYIYDANYFSIYDNEIFNNSDDGIDIINSAGSYSSIDSNNISFNGANGVFIRSGTNNIDIYLNSFHNNSKYGVEVRWNQCKFYLNDFVGNNASGWQAYDSNGNNFWNWTDMDGKNWGNYWNNKSAIDNNEDGINDFSRRIPGALTYDQRPLMWSQIYYDLHEIFVKYDYSSSTPGWKITRFATIQEGINAAHTFWATVFVFNGTYYENIVMNKSNVELIGESRDGAIIDGGFNDHTIEVNAFNCDIIGFTLRNSGVGGNNASIYLNNIWDCIVENCNLSYSFFGIYINFGGSHDIIGNIIINNTEDGIFLDNSGNHFIINNYVINNSKSGIHLLWSDWNEIMDNDVSFNQWDGLHIEESEYNNITHNIISDNIQTGIAGFGYDTRNNTIFDNEIEFNGWWGIHLSNETRDNFIALNFIFYNAIENANDSTDYGNYWFIWNPEWNNFTGNYWGDYYGSDPDRDGIGNEPYTIPGGAFQMDYFPLIVDFWNPYVKILSPANYSIYNTEPNIYVEIFDERTLIDKMWCVVNDSAANFFADNGTIDINWDSFADGEYLKIQFFANDTWGNVNDSQILLIQKDTSAPSIVILDPNDGGVYNDFPPIQVDANDPHLDKIWYNFTYNNHIEFLEDSVPEELNASTSWDFLSDGSYTIRFYANDTAGNFNDSLSITVIKDYTAPQITVIAPVSQQNCSAPPLVQVSVEETNIIDKIWYNFSNNIEFLENNIAETMNNTIWSLLTEGPNTIYFYANDTTGNLNSSVSVVIIKDTINPWLTVNTPANETVWGATSENVNVTIYEIYAKDYWYRVGDSLIDRSFYPGNNNTEFQINNDDWGSQNDGEVLIYFWAEDWAGNLNYTVLNLTKSTGTPIIQIYSPSGYEVFNIICPTFNFNFTNNVTAADRVWVQNGTGGDISTKFTYWEANSDHSNINDVLSNWYDDWSDGEVKFIFWADNPSGESFKPIIIIKDTTEPTIKINAPLKDYIFSTPPSFEVNLTEMNLDANGSLYYVLNSSATKHFVSIDKGSKSQVLFGTIESTDWYSWLDGFINITFFSNDTVGNMNWTFILVEKDTTKPNLTIETPGTGDPFNDAPPTYILNITDKNYDMLWYAMQNEGYSTNYTSKYNGTIDSDAWNYFGVNGPIIIKFWCNDTAGNIANEKQVQIIRDTISPELTINEPDTNDKYNAPPAYDLTLNDIHSSVHTIWVTYGTPTGQKYFLPNESYFLGSEFLSFNDGNILIWFHCNDSAGNENSDDVLVQKDTTPPEVYIIEPFDGQAFNDNYMFDGNPPYLLVDTYDELNHDPDIMYNISNNYGWLIDGIREFIPMSIWGPLSDGVYTIYFYANDSLGNLNATESITVVKDTQNPWIDFVLSPVWEQNCSSAPLIHVVVREERELDTIWYEINGRIEILENNTAEYLDESIWDSISEGDFWLNLMLNDTANNWGGWGINLRKDTVAPQVVEIDGKLEEGNIYGGAFGFEVEFSELISTFKYNLTVYYWLDSMPNYCLIGSGQDEFSVIINATLFSLLRDGNFTLKLWFDDYAGNYEELAFVLVKDTTPPSFNPETNFIGFDPDTDNLTARTFTLAPVFYLFIPEDLIDLTYIIYNTEGNPLQSASIRLAQYTFERSEGNISAGTYKLEIDPILWSAVDDGNVTITIKMTDKANNVVEYTYTVLKASDDQPGGGFDMMFILIIVIVAVAGVSVSSLVVVTRRSKKKIQEIQEALPQKKLDVDASRYKIRKDIKPADAGSAPVGKKAPKKTKIASYAPEEKRELTELEKAAIAQTEEEMAIEKAKHICVVHKGKIKGAMYLCPECDSMYCMDCAKALKMKDEKCWACDAEIDIVIPETERVTDVSDNAKDILQDLIEYDDAMTEAINMEKPFEEVSGLEFVDFTSVDLELLSLIDTFHWSVKKKQQFIYDLLSLTPAEREALVKEMVDFQAQKDQELEEEQEEENNY